jgi:hypothetical protein
LCYSTFLEELALMRFALTVRGWFSRIDMAELDRAARRQDARNEGGLNCERVGPHNHND